MNKRKFEKLKAKAQGNYNFSLLVSFFILNSFFNFNYYLFINYINIILIIYYIID